MPFSPELGKVHVHQNLTNDCRNVFKKWCTIFAIALQEREKSCLQYLILLYHNIAHTFVQYKPHLIIRQF